MKKIVSREPSAVNRDAGSGIVDLLGKYGAAEGGMTMQEICEATGWGVSSARLKVRAAVTDGVMEFCGKKKTRRIDGAEMSSPVYRVVRGRKA